MPWWWVTGKLSSLVQSKTVRYSYYYGHGSKDSQEIFPVLGIASKGSWTPKWHDQDRNILQLLQNFAWRTFYICALFFCRRFEFRNGQKTQRKTCFGKNIACYKKIENIIGFELGWESKSQIWTTNFSRFTLNLTLPLLKCLLSPEPIRKVVERERHPTTWNLNFSGVEKSDENK